MPAFNPAKPKLQYQLTFEGSWPTSVVFLGSSRRLAAANQLGQIFIWDLPEIPPAFKVDPKTDRKAPNVWPVRRLDGHLNEISRLAATSDGKLLVSASFDHTVRIWPIGGPAAGKSEAILNEETRKREKQRTGKKDAAPAPGITVETQTACDVLTGHNEWIYALGISRDGKRLISGDAASQVIVWDIATRKPVMKWSGLPWNWIVAASLSPDGSTALVSEYRYKRDDFDIPAPGLKLWSTTTGKETPRSLEIGDPQVQ
jgi:WD40 repeat protein